MPFKCNLQRHIVAAYAPLVVALCGHPAVASGHPLLRGAALAALSRLMAIDAGFCEEHLALIFTRLRGETDKGTRAALMVALVRPPYKLNPVDPERLKPPGCFNPLSL